MVNGNPVYYDEIMIQQKTEWEWLNSENHARMDILLPVVSWTPGQGLASPQAIRRFRFKSGADTFYLCSYYSRKFIEKIFPKISKFYHSSGLLILEIWSHDYFAGYQICFIIWKTLESNPPAFIGWGGSAAKKHGGASVKDHWWMVGGWLVLISILHSIHCWSQHVQGMGQFRLWPHHQRYQHGGSVLSRWPALVGSESRQFFHGDITIINHIWGWVKTYYYHICGNQHPLASYFRYRLGPRVMTHSHITIYDKSSGKRMNLTTSCSPLDFCMAK